MQNTSFQSLFSSEATMQAQHYAKTKMDYLVFNGYNSLAVQDKISIESTEFKDSVALGTVSTDANGISHRLVTVNVYKDDEIYPRASLKQVFYSNDANKFVTNGSSATSSISMNYDKENDRLYVMVDGEEKSLGGGSGVPIGTVIAWASNTIPTEGGVWLECNGQSCAAYPELAKILGKNNVPDYRGRFLEGSATAGTVKEAGLPNITGVTTGLRTWYFPGPSGAFAIQSDTYGPYGKDGTGRVFKFDASRCSAIYGNSTTVQPPSVTVRYLIKAA